MIWPFGKKSKAKTDGQTLPENATEHFWAWILDNAQRMEASAGQALPADLLDGLSSQIKTIDKGLTFEFGRDTNGIYELVISAECNRELFPVVFDVIKAAPKIENWRLTALKPQSDPGISIEIGGLTLTPKDTQIALAVAEDSAPVQVIFFVPEMTEQTKGLYVHGLAILTDAILGEWLSAEMIHSFDIVDTLPEHTAVYNLSELPELVEQRRQDFDIPDPFATRH